MNKHDLQKLFERHLDREQTKCLCPDCTEPPIGSHSIQRSRYLAPLAENGSVYFIQNEPLGKLLNVSGTAHYKIGKAHIKSFSVFPGLCSEHDDRLFAPIEKTDPDFSNFQHQFLFSYRSVLREGYSRRRAAEIVCGIVHEVHQKAGTNPKDGSEYGTVTGIAGGSHFFDPIVKKYHQRHGQCTLWKRREWDSIVIRKEGVPAYIVCESVFEVIRDDPEDLKYVTMHVLPSQGGLDVLFFFRRRHRPIIETFLRKCLGEDFAGNLSLLKLSTLMLCRSEIFCVSPQRYEKLPAAERALMLELFSNNTDMFVWNVRSELNLWA